MKLRKSLIVSTMLLTLSAFSSISAFAATSYVYNGDISSGWSSSGVMNTTRSCGYDGKSYWYYGKSDPTSSGMWSKDLDGRTEYAVYIPSCNSTGSVKYHAWYEDGQRADLNVNQLNYSNEWVILGTYRGDSNSSIGMSNNWASSSSKVVWDEARFKD